MQKTNVSFAAFIAIALTALITDYLVFFFKIPYGFSLATAFLTIAIVAFIKRKFLKEHISFNFQKADILFFLVFLIIFCFEIGAPLTAYDEANYHIYLQENAFTDKINFDYFAGKNLNAFLFPLGDRMFYIIRFLIGYRLGVLLSYFTIICVYYQVKKLLSCLNTKNKNKKLIPFFSAAIVFTQVILILMTHSYYIDSFSIPLILEIVIQCIALKNGQKISKKKTLYISLLAGIAGAIKVTNLLLALAIIIATKFIKKIKVNFATIAISFAAIIVPIAPYAIDNFIQTGSPLYPYYNKIFQSPYFADENFQDERFNIPKILSFFVWPIYTSVFNPKYGDNSGIIDATWAIGYIAILVILRINIGRKDKNKNAHFLIYISLICTIVWVFGLAGYMRYAMVIPIMYLAVLACTLMEIKKLPQKITCITLALIAIITPLPTVERYLYGRSAENFFKDKNFKIHIDGVWGVIDDDSFLTSMVREEGTPIYNLDVYQNSTSELTKNLTREKIEGKEFYMLTDNMLRWYYSKKVKYLEMNGWQIEELIHSYDSKEMPYLTKYDYAYLIKVKYVGTFPDEPTYEAKNFFPLNNPDYY
ncbi:MAG: hypothetical protein MJ154_00635 [Candidatus Saccharibacteria bacterium]|nr:hypothetical protein [Candidatus Saccharibacteria bacterium]